MPFLRFIRSKGKPIFLGALLVLFCTGNRAFGGTLVFFEAHLTPEEVVPREGAPSPAGVSDARGYATFDLDLDFANPTIRYEMSFSGINLFEDVTGIHIHQGNAPTSAVPAGLITPSHLPPDVINGPHALNIYGLPREDDADLVVSQDGFFLSGVWDNMDRNYGTDGNRDPGDSISAGDAVLEFFEEQLYVQVHTWDYNAPNTGELRGQIRMIPEPAPALLVILGALTLFTGRVRRGFGRC